MTHEKICPLKALGLPYPERLCPTPVACFEPDAHCEVMVARQELEDESRVFAGLDEITCECDDDSRESPVPLSWYSDEEIATNAPRHAPGDCHGNVDLALYRYEGGREVWLCSCCCPSDQQGRISR